jgi:SAM-dependent methyltransferase
VNKPFVIPKEFVVNAKDVLAMGSPAHVGKLLMEHLAWRIGHKDLAGVEILDFGCGSRFTDSIINCPIQVGKYVGVDTNPSLIAFFKRERRRSCFVLLSLQLVQSFL